MGGGLGFGLGQLDWGGGADLLHDHVVRVGKRHPNHDNAVAEPVLEVDSLAAGMIKNGLMRNALQRDTPEFPANHAQHHGTVVAVALVG